MRRNLFWLSDDHWHQIEPLLPTDVRGKERVDDRRVTSGILHILKSGWEFFNRIDPSRTYASLRAPSSI